ncbi:hypothetical protein GN958_ATG11719 [Phytophthora infestans]|uniref:Uncharacterized protein n=1 Tax=Phytophthora infestans TaxID=4787 RepID=A0A8S9UHW9_PHYIN|nr:hypothetical protein GN958_ATG11719 [Phytophthora infestans]
MMVSKDPGECTYRSGKCSNPRATKTNGALHKMCESNRDRVNKKISNWRLKKADHDEESKSDNQERHFANLEEGEYMISL